MVGVLRRALRVDAAVKTRLDATQRFRRSVGSDPDDVPGNVHTVATATTPRVRCEGAVVGIVVCGCERAHDIYLR